MAEINEQIWKPFSQSFKNLDFNLFESIHHDDFLRINGNGKYLKNKEGYLSTYKKNWEDKSRNIKIEFRFIERINSNTHASERGIYKMTVNPESDQAQSFYGKFHVIMQKFANNWKLLVDYDSDEGKTIGVENYNAAHGIDDYEKY